MNPNELLDIVNSGDNLPPDYRAYAAVERAIIDFLSDKSPHDIYTTTDLALQITGLGSKKNVPKWVWNVMTNRVIKHRPLLAKYAFSGPVKLVMGKTSTPVFWRNQKVTS